MLNLCNTLLYNVRVHAILGDIGKTIKTIPVINSVIEVDFSSKITIVITDSKIVFGVF